MDTISRTRPLIIAAAIPSLLSLAWTAWSVADMIPAPLPVALAAGIALDIMLVAAVAIAWTSPAAARPAQTVSWIIATLATAAIGVHSFEITPALVLLAPLPMVSKALWGLALSAKTTHDQARAEQEQAEREQADARRREAERKAARLSTALTEDQEAEMAALERERVYVESKSERELALAEARAKVAQEQRLAEIRRQAETQMATDEATAQIHVRRHELAQQIQLAAPLQAQALPAVPDDASSITGTLAAAQGAHPCDQRTPEPGVSDEDALSEGERNRLAVLAAYDRLSSGGVTPSVSAVADAAGVSRRTVNRHLPK
ncbi:hypothetical protein ABZ635_22645 [Nocardiopsis sp. NPDC007018]|uniref:hypothetical protein n=1 Tax=Nocardiopsis sp. NPDC007018 TaxID=3155721 RepID=UPI0033D21032